jgi:hypothetical protein
MMASIEKSPLFFTRCLRAALLLLGLCWASEASADGLALTWQAPAGCPEGERARKDIETLAGRELSTGVDDTVVTATLAQEEAAWVAVLSIGGPGAPANERRVEGKTCREVADASAAIIALALVTPREPDPPPPPIDKPEPPPVPRPPPKAEPPIFGGLISAFGGVDFTALPSPSAGFGLSGALRFLERNRVELRAAGFLPQTEAVGPAGADVALFAGTLRYCRVLFGNVASLTVCGGLEGGAMVASAFGFKVNDSGVGRWVAPELAIQLEIHPVRAFGIHLELEGLAPIARDAFLIDEDRVFRSAPLDARVLLGASFGAP